MAPDPVDTVKALFDALPAVVAFDRTNVLNTSSGSFSGLLVPQLTTFVNRCQSVKAGSNNLTDTDSAFLYEKITRILSAPYDCDALFISMLGELALNKGQKLHDTTANSKKDQYLRYAAWIARGRRDAESPFEPALAQTQPSRPREYYATLTAQTAEQSQKQCAHCGKLVKHPVPCKRCLVDERWAYVRVSYCDEYCQVAGWPDHNSACHSRRLLGRAVSIVRALNQTFENYTFDFSYKSAVAKDGIVRLEEFTEGLDDRSEGYTLIPDAFKGGFVFRSPPHVSGRDSDRCQDYDEAVLRYNKCAELATVQWNFIGPFLDCVCPSIHEMTILPKNASVVVSRMNCGGLESGMLSNHAVFRLKSANEEVFIVDLAGSQYGFHEVLSLEKDFVKSRVVNHERPQPIGLGREMEHMMRMFTAEDCVERAGSVLKEEMAKEIFSQIRLYLASKNFTGGNAIKRMLSSDKRTFDQCRGGILSLTERVITGIIEKYKSKGLYCLCLDTKLNVRVTENQHWAEVYRRVWLKDEEWRPIRNKQEELVMKWRSGLSHPGSNFLKNIKQAA